MTQERQTAAAYITEYLEQARAGHIYLPTEHHSLLLCHWDYWINQGRLDLPPSQLYRQPENMGLVVADAGTPLEEMLRLEHGGVPRKVQEIFNFKSDGRIWLNSRGMMCLETSLGLDIRVSSTPDDYQTWWFVEDFYVNDPQQASHITDVVLAPFKNQPVSS